jgi:hypothetical protein
MEGVIAIAALNGKHCGRPKLRGEERVQNSTLAGHGSFRALAEQDGCMFISRSFLSPSKGRKREKDRPLMGFAPSFSAHVRWCEHGAPVHTLQESQFFSRPVMPSSLPAFTTERSEVITPLIADF